MNELDRYLRESVWVVIPALNEEKSIGLVLRDLPCVAGVIVVDNGCTDQTAVIAEQAGALVVREPQRGYGAACLRGLAKLDAMVRDGKANPQAVAFVDADYSDHSDRLPELVRPIASDNADFVLGSRLLGERERGAMPPQSVFGNQLACLLMRMLFGVRYTDLGPFRVINYRQLCELQMRDENFGWTIEMQIKASRLGLRSLEIPVPYRTRIGTSKISGTLSGSVKAGYKILFTIAKHGFLPHSNSPGVSFSKSAMSCSSER
ncbi:glycosyltransferase family 2 protein [Rhodopirellula sp. P2]|uniref:glycosyltransferase family 2 protein n=1 Tax=Rhodopirellula sp. P2 TaxID=2127060 RepID=UPI002367807F|nr:glycosyltransferase family 2 protein [Rhodopirellula sp. P2]WDQ17166.1 glycosyltransferase family 2 protein [Rhodopirellula sp. P2]